MKYVAPICTALVLAITPAFAEEKKAAFDAAKLVGTWKYVAGTRGGEKVPEERLAGEVVITKETFTLPAGPDAKFVMGYKVDGKASPATIDLEIKDGPVKEGKAQGIISVDGDKIKLCYVNVADNAKRPAKFESTADNKAFMFELKKVK